MKKFKTEYIQKYLIKGNFESNFISKKIDAETKKKILASDGRYKLKDKNSDNTIELVGRHIIKDAKIIKSLPKGIEDKTAINPRAFRTSNPSF